MSCKVNGIKLKLGELFRKLNEITSYADWKCFIIVGFIPNDLSVVLDKSKNCPSHGSNLQ